MQCPLCHAGPLGRHQGHSVTWSSPILFPAAALWDADSLGHTPQGQCCDSDSFSEGLPGDLTGADHLVPRAKPTDAERRRSGSPHSPRCAPHGQTAAGLPQSPSGSCAAQPVGIGEQTAPLAAALGSLAILGAASVWHEMDASVHQAGPRGENLAMVSRGWLWTECFLLLLFPSRVPKSSI